MNEEAATADDAGSDAGAVLDELVGPFYDAAGVTRYLKLGAGELTEQVAANQIIAVPLASGTPVFPTWQFHPDRHVHAPLLAVWQTLRQAADPWTAACWMCAPSRDLDGHTAIDHLVRDPVGDAPDPRRLATVLVLAAADCARWLQ